MKKERKTIKTQKTKGTEEHYINVKVSEDSIIFNRFFKMLTLDIVAFAANMLCLMLFDHEMSHKAYIFYKCSNPAIWLCTILFYWAFLNGQYFKYTDGSLKENVASWLSDGMTMSLGLSSYYIARLFVTDFGYTFHSVFNCLKPLIAVYILNIFAVCILSCLSYIKNIKYVRMYDCFNMYYACKNPEGQFLNMTFYDFIIFVDKIRGTDPKNEGNKEIKEADEEQIVSFLLKYLDQKAERAEKEKTENTEAAPASESDKNTEEESVDNIEITADEVNTPEEGENTETPDDTPTDNDDTDTGDEA